MKRVCLLFFVLVSVFMQSVWADSPAAVFPSDAEVGTAVEVIADCMISVLATEYSQQDIDIPGTSVSMNTKKNLPEKITFRKTDPGDIAGRVSAFLSGGQKQTAGGFLSSLVRAAKDPYLSMLNYYLSGKNYERGAFSISGTVELSYPPEASFTGIFTALAVRKPEENLLTFRGNIGVSEAETGGTLTLSGTFVVSVDEYQSITVKSTDSFYINGREMKGGVFRF